MKNLKKLSKGEMKTIGGGEHGKWACCTSSGQCSTPVYGNSDNLYCADKGTSLKKMSLSISEDLG